mmetsp:Transcript_12042/g.22404  ORF Transcript_12042/g.22404 Transcript_12042/m.22404 type:complete len:96 (-) Transcript_12042:202-489(-)
MFAENAFTHAIGVMIHVAVGYTPSATASTAIKHTVKIASMVKIVMLSIAMFAIRNFVLIVDILHAAKIGAILVRDVYWRLLEPAEIASSKKRTKN